MRLLSPFFTSIWVHKTSLILSLCIEVPVTSQKKGNICKGYQFCHFMVFWCDLGTILTVWHFLFFISFYYYLSCITSMILHMKSMKYITQLASPWLLSLSCPYWAIIRGYATLPNVIGTVVGHLCYWRSPLAQWGRRGSDRMVVGFTTTRAISSYHRWCCEFEFYPVLYDFIVQNILSSLLLLCYNLMIMNDYE